MSFAAVIRALQSDADNNIMGMPTLVTMDNEEAQIQVGQEVPFVTGSFTDTGTAGGALNPFQTVERQQVGLTLKITPQTWIFVRDRKCLTTGNRSSLSETAC